MIADALIRLAPTAQWKIIDDQIEWLSEDIPMPSAEDIQRVVQELTDERESTRYQRQRAPEYPTLTDFADAYYWAQKGDNTLMDAYIAKCDAVKTKYSKV